MTVDKWEGRQLCEDGACTGVIGQDGTCKMCGKPAPNFGDFRKPGRVSSKSEVDEAEEEASDAETVASPAKVAAKGGTVAAWNERKLCSDGACVGVIGAGGKCKVCGKTADGSEPGDEDEDEDEEDLEDDEVASEDGGDDDEDDNEDDDEDDDDDDDDDEVAQDDDDDDDDDDDEDDEADEDDDEAEEERKLCVDGACVGVIGDNGKCKVCGKAAA